MDFVTSQSWWSQASSGGSAGSAASPDSAFGSPHAKDFRAYSPRTDLYEDLSPRADLYYGDLSTRALASGRKHGSSSVSRRAGKSPGRSRLDGNGDGDVLLREIARLQEDLEEKSVQIRGLNRRIADAENTESEGKEMRQRAETLQQRLDAVQKQLASRDAGVKGDNAKWLEKVRGLEERAAGAEQEVELLQETLAQHRKRISKQVPERE
ncbi:hypothetical protein T484DRAFT_1822543 [Baffinella frigidus]|nr:hypothetical protein T484DRAFT_1822543 [Cryptophyta sp. CCMP2293]